MVPDPYGEPPPRGDPPPSGPTPLWAVGASYLVASAAMLIVAEFGRELRFFCSPVPDRTAFDYLVDGVAIALGVAVPILVFARYKPQTGPHRIVAGVMACLLAGVVTQLLPLLPFLPFNLAALGVLPYVLGFVLLVIGPLSLIPAFILEIVLAVRLWHAED
ncbi:hypothetical protein LBMAG42_12880 [Deltaproteobacteria bacterium]|nr:hypothetical protein LBMAG42_12880 [Deltaproteobacteria bacterium]